MFGTPFEIFGTVHLITIATIILVSVFLPKLYKNKTNDQFEYESLKKTKGLAFHDENNELIVTGNAEQIPAAEGYLHCHDFEKLREGLIEFSGSDEALHKYFPKIKEVSEFDGHMIKGQVYPEMIRAYERNKNKMKIGKRLYY